MPTFQLAGDRDVKATDNGVSLSATRGQEGGPVIPNGWSAIYGSYRYKHGKSANIPGYPRHGA